jgi:AbiV family abortive infection protein
MTVAVRYLLEGAWYALEQCGRLLHDAIDLYERDRFGTAVGLAILAREELGKARILIQLSGEVEAGKGLSLRELSSALADHLEKQEHAQISVVLSAGCGTRLQELFKKAGDPQIPSSRPRMLSLRRSRSRRGGACPKNGTVCASEPCTWIRRPAAGIDLSTSRRMRPETS